MTYLASRALAQNGKAEDFRAALKQLEENFTLDSTDGVQGFISSEKSKFGVGVSVQAMIVCDKKKGVLGWFISSSEGQKLSVNSSPEERRN